MDASISRYKARLEKQFSHNDLGQQSQILGVGIMPINLHFSYPTSLHPRHSSSSKHE